MDDPTIRTGDIVLHRPSGERWIVAAVDGADLYWCGWPDGCALVADCEVTERASDAEHRRLIEQVRATEGRRVALARAHACSVCAEVSLG